MKKESKTTIAAREQIARAILARQVAINSQKSSRGRRFAGTQIKILDDFLRYNPDGTRVKMPNRVLEKAIGMLANAQEALESFEEKAEEIQESLETLRKHADTVLANLGRSAENDRMIVATVSSANSLINASDDADTLKTMLEDF